MMAGRPRGKRNSCTKRVAERICAEVIKGKSLLEISQMENMPCYIDMHSWLSGSHKEYFQEEYKKAREIRAEHLMMEVLRIADGETDDDNARAKLKIDSRKWLIEKLFPEAVEGDQLQAIKILRKVVTQDNA